MTVSRFKTLAWQVLIVACIYGLCLMYAEGMKKRYWGSAVRFGPVIEEVASVHKIHPALIAAIIHTESNFNPRACSRAGAKGLMQINTPTQKHLNLKDVYDPRKNIEAGTRYLLELMNRYDGNLTVVLAAYNAGPTAVARFRGVPPYRETRKYIEKVLTHYERYRQAFLLNPLLS